MNWKLIEQYDRVTAAVVAVAIIIIMIFAVTGPVDEEVVAEQVQEQPTKSMSKVEPQFTTGQVYKVEQKPPSAWKYIVVKSGNCYTIGTDDDSGWLVNDCFSLERARKKAGRMNASGDRKNEFGAKTWTVVE